MAYPPPPKRRIGLGRALCLVLLLLGAAWGAAARIDGVLLGAIVAGAIVYVSGGRASRYYR